MRTVLSTKKLTFSQRKKLLEAGLSVIEHNFIQIEYLDFEPSNHTPDYLIFTSGNAVKSVLKNNCSETYKQIPAVCVGENTRKFLLKNGWNVLFSANSAANLAKKIVQELNPNCKMIFFNGNLRKNDLPNLLTQHYFQLQEIQVYKTQLNPITINYHTDAILFFSPSAVKSYLSENQIDNDMFIFCIGKSTSQSIEKHFPIFVAKKPSIEEVITDCISYLNKNTLQS